MAEFNKVVLLGRLTRDPDLRYTGAKLAVCEFSLATHHHYRAHEEVKDEVSFVDIVVFGKPGESSKEYLKKRSRVWVDGRLVQRRWETAKGKNEANSRLSQIWSLTRGLTRPLPKLRNNFALLPLMNT